jgi:hypothetical protein
MQIIAVVDADAAANTVTVWHVDVGSQAPGMSRMCGAWVFNNESDKVELLTRDRLIVATAAGGAAVRSGDRGPIGTIDLVGTVNNVVSERDRLQAIYAALPAPRKKTLVAPRWPDIPTLVGLSGLPKAENADPVVAVALGIARCMDQIANAWADCERERITRDYLTDNTPGRPSQIRDIPVELESESSSR